VADPLFSTTWVHLYEEDTSEGAVYRPDQSDIPLSRRPREQLQLDRDGRARWFTAGPNDRLVEQAATWVEETGSLTIRTQDGHEMRVVSASPERLVVRTTRP
jgi:hypothetical protein